jgi:REP element-mobilizing transposase RayT
MPNHIHGIIQITETTVGTPLVGVRNATNMHNATIDDGNSPDGTMVACKNGVDVAVGTADDKTGVCCESGRGRTGTRPVPTGPAGMVVDYKPGETLGDFVGAFKSIIMHRYCNGVKMGLVPPLNKRLFQHRFHDHIIRNEFELFRIRQYIQNNPANWYNDRMNALNNNTVQEIGVIYGEESWMV